MWFLKASFNYASSDWTSRWRVEYSLTQTEAPSIHNFSTWRATFDNPCNSKLTIWHSRPLRAVIGRQSGGVRGSRVWISLSKPLFFFISVTFHRTSSVFHEDSLKLYTIIAYWSHYYVKPLRVSSFEAVINTLASNVEWHIREAVLSRASL